MKSRIGQCFPYLAVVSIFSFSITAIIYFESLSMMKQKSLSFLNNQKGYMNSYLPWLVALIERKPRNNFIRKDLIHHQGSFKKLSLNRKTPARTRDVQRRKFPNVHKHLRYTSRDQNTTNSLIANRDNGLLVFGESLGCESLDPQILLFNRIFKTGSTTTSYLLNKTAPLMNCSFYAATTEDWYETGNSYPYPGVVKTIATRKLHNFSRLAFAGHFYFRKDFQLTNTHTYISQVRHPIKRFVSHYFYIHKSKDRPAKRIKELIDSGQINETIEECYAKQRQGCKNNVMTRFFCGTEDYCKTGNRKALLKAKFNIKTYYASVGILEYFNLYLKVLKKRLPYFINNVKVVTRLKVTPHYNTSALSPNIIKKITKANWADIKLYEFIRGRFWRQVKECGVNPVKK